MSAAPDRLAYLQVEVATRLLSTAVLERREAMPIVAIDKVCTPAPWPAEPVRQLIEEALKRFELNPPTQADAWLAPRLHAALRLTRAEAADPGLWAYLAMRVASDYVVWRHPGRNPKHGQVRSINKARFVGPFDTQAFARLWWAAELFRDGPDYRPVVVACGNQDVLNTVLGLRVILHRPVAQALLRLVSDGRAATGREVNALAQAVNAAGSTLVYEALAPDVGQDPDAYRDWIDEGHNGFVPYDALPDGPDDGQVSHAAIHELVALFARLYDEAPVRGRDR
ncbi:hypothetical protein FHU36_001754 [Nonomuraea muscovyensis]|uniref:Uncharacterized protein n=1 Tax=Nonomuraea muscovyensis TaxID=1124761 RepID=A0A7X0EXX5_9ACTN|nr:DUF6339 family protein [Nonomuraea muscovyensis]MBB6345245.1 hypothetical protein [Nonomuraea muscovyensis]